MAALKSASKPFAACIPHIHCAILTTGTQQVTVADWLEVYCPHSLWCGGCGHREEDEEKREGIGRVKEEKEAEKSLKVDEKV